MSARSKTELDREGNSTPWWQNSSIFGIHTSEQHDMTVSGSNREPEDVLIPVGGARAQSRFSGKTAMPMFREEAKDTEMKLHSKQHRSMHPIPGKVGYRCDGKPVVTTGSTFKTEWVFSFESWSWRKKNDRDTGNISVVKWDSSEDNVMVDKKIRGQNKWRIEKLQGPECLKSISGFDDVKQKIIEQVIMPLRYAKICRRVGVFPGRGVIVHGPSGCGKTHLLSTLGKECGIYMETISCCEFINELESEKVIKKAFTNAKKASPAILFVDNFEILSQTGYQASQNGINGHCTHVFLKYLDDLRKEKCDVVVICATSTIDSIHPSLRRHGRLDLEISMGRQLSAKEKFDILKACLSNSRYTPDLILESMQIEDSMQGFLACDISGLVREAGLLAVVDAIRASNGDENLLLLDENIPTINQSHLTSALQTIRVPSTLRQYNSFQNTVPWESIGGLDQVKQQLIEMIEWPLQYQKIISSFGLPLSTGALLYGAPGCGKTLLAKAVASSCKANFICISGPEILQKWVGESESSIREIFRLARLSKPCVVFLDELDALAPRRKSISKGNTSAGGDTMPRIVAQLLCEIDGLGNKDGGNNGVIVIGATNRPDAIDPALLRPGRLSEMIHVPLPDHQSRICILQSNLDKCPKDSGFNLERFAEKHADLLEGLTGADLTEVARRAGMDVIRMMIQNNNPPESEITLTEGILFDALKGMRKSVSQASVSYYDHLVKSVANGKGFDDTDSSNTSSIPIEMAIKLTEQVVQAKCSSLRNRVLELEQLLERHGIDFAHQEPPRDITT